MSFFRFYLEVLKRAFWVSLQKVALFATVLAVLGGALAYFFPDFTDLVGVSTWLIPIAIFLVVAAARLVLAPYWIYVDESGRAHSAESLLMVARQSLPRLRFQSARQAQMYRPSPVVDDKVKTYEMLQAWFENRPESPTAASVASQLTATLEFQTDESKAESLRVHGQWAQTTAPDHVGHSGTAPEIDISPGALYGKLIVALKYQDESSAYAYSAESLQNHIDGRNPSLELTQGEHMLRVELAGIGVNKAFDFILANPGEGGSLDLRLREDRES